MPTPSLGWYPPPAEQYLRQIEQLLFPERYMSADEIAAAVEAGRLNADGAYEWSGADDLEEVARIVTAARRAGTINNNRED